MPWRTEPEIDAERQRFLAERRAVAPDIEHGIYPFRDENGGITLGRADVEWLLATHESGGVRGPVNWDDGAQRQRDGLDLRGAVLRDADGRGADERGADLSGLPLARLYGGLDGGAEYARATPDQREWAVLHLPPGGRLDYARLEGARLTGAYLPGVSARSVRFWGAELYAAHLEGDPPADLSFSAFDAGTRLDYAVVANDRHVGPRLRGVNWGGVDLSFVDWSPVHTLDDERRARASEAFAPGAKGRDARLQQFRRAVQANSVLATALRGQGSSQQADQFAYRAQFLQREVLRLEGHWLRWLGSLLLDAISGYGYRPLRSVAAYVAIIAAFAGAYLLNAQFAAPHLRWDEALVLSVSSFHGRGFFTTGVSLGDTLARLAAGEAIIGLLVEITFIATFTQRFFAR
jgi:uncharacterized protein YjbI with pentapeptide repeats